MVERKTIEVEVFDEDLQDDPQPFMDWLKGVCEKIPEEYKEDATIQTWGGEFSSYIKVLYNRPETDDEYARRIAVEEASRKQYEANRRAREIDMLRSLKAKYPDVS